MRQPMQGHQHQLSAYELERQQRIAENKAKLMEIGVAEARDQLLATQQAGKQAKAASKPKQRKAKALVPERRSDRNAGRDRPDYRGQQELAVFVERQPRLRMAARPSKPGRQRDGNSRYPSWHMGIPDAPSAAIEEAFAAATELAQQSTDDGTPAYTKVMHPSMVGGGGWLQAPLELAQHYCAPSDITFTAPDTCRPASDFRYTQLHRSEGDSRDDAWTVGFIQKTDKKTGVAKGGYGFSKNWKGFAADQFLHPGDSVVFQVTGPDEAVVHIFRAWDYASDSSKPEGFEALRFSRAAGVATPVADADAAAGAQQQQGGKAAAAAAADEEEEDNGTEEEEEAAGSAAGDDMSERADDTAAADQHKKAAAKRSKGSSRVLGSQQQAAAAAAPSKASKLKAAGSNKLRAAGTATGAASGSKRQRCTGSSSSSKKSTKRPRAEPANAPAAAAGSDRGSKKQKQQQQQSAAKQKQPKQKKQKQQQQQQQDQGDEGEEDFVVDWILDTKVIGGVRVFKVRWLGYGADHDTWEPADMFGGIDPLSYDWGRLQSNGNIKRIAPPKTLEH